MLFHTTRSIRCSINSSKSLGEHLLPYIPLRSSVLIITDRGILQSALELPALQSLKEHGFDAVVYSDVLPNPPEANVKDAVALAVSVGAKAVIGLGGGSSMDVAKLVAFLSLPGQKQKLQDLYGVDMCKGPRLPLIQIPTTAGTGSEVTPIAIITTGAMEKKGVVSSQLLPDMALLDAALTISLPKKVTGMTGLDAMVHAIEAMTSRVKKNRLSNMFAREALSLLGDNILRVTESEEGSQDLIARENMLLGSMYAGMAFANAPVGAVHALAYPVGTLFHVPHGLSISLVLPAVLRFNIQHGNEETKQAYAHCAKMLFPEVVSQSLSGTSTQQAKALVIGFEMLATRLGLETKLSQMGIQQKDVEQLALDTMKQTRLLPNNPCDVRKEDAVAMFNEVL